MSLPEGSFVVGGGGASQLSSAHFHSPAQLSSVAHSQLRMSRSWISRNPGNPGSGPDRVRSSYSELEKLENLFFSSSYSELRVRVRSSYSELEKVEKKLEKFFQVWSSQMPHTVPGLFKNRNSKLEKLEKRIYYTILDIYRHRILEIPDREIPGSRDPSLPASEGTSRPALEEPALGV